MPSPSEQRRAEVLLKRLLHCCEQAVDADGAWCASAQAHFDVDTAQDLLAQLTALGSVSEHLLTGLSQRTHALRARLRPPLRRPAYLRAPVARVALPDAAAVPSSASGSSAFDAATAPGLIRRRAAAPRRDGGGGASAAAALDAHAALHDEITGELVGMSAQLRRNAYAMHAAVRDSVRVLDDVGAAVEHSLSSTGRATDKAKAIYAVNRASCWAQCAVFAAVTLVFAWTVVLIRFNRNRLKPMLDTLNTPNGT